MNPLAANYSSTPVILPGPRGQVKGRELYYSPRIDYARREMGRTSGYVLKR